MEKVEPLIEEINNITNNEYKFMLKSATLDEAADFCIVEIFYKDGIILEKNIKDKVENRILELVPSSFTYKIVFVKNFISEERILSDVKNIMENEYASISHSIESVKRDEMTFNIELFIDVLSFEYAENKRINNIIESKLKSLYEDYTFVVSYKKEVVYKIDEKKELINSYKEEEVDASQFRKIDIYDLQVLVNDEITGTASYIVDKNSPEENVTICGKVKAKKIIVIKRKPKVKETEENENNETDENTNDESEEIKEQVECLKEEIEKESEELNEPKYERKLYKWALEDITGQIGCVFMSNKENQTKLEGLNEGDIIAVHGKVENDKFSGDLTFKVHDISYCKIPEDTKEYIIYRKEKPFYEFVEPEPVVMYEQNSLMNFLDERVIPKYLKDKTFVCYDLETTGLHFERGDRMVEIGAVKIVNGKITEKFRSYVNPDGKKIDPKASETTGIYDEDVADALMDYQVLQDFYKFTRDAVIIGYNNINFDNVFLFGQAKKCRWNFDNETEDVFKLAQKYVSGVKNYKLGTIASSLGVLLENAHSAIYDAMATAEIFIKIAENIE
ncbi:MAG: 3'-5' exoribonuclease [Clostridia bacterium]|nr:3'-5' exoribonuclease [Clostridia bacterium]